MEVRKTFKELKLEVAFAIIFIAGYIVMRFLPNAEYLNVFLENYFTSERLGIISDFFAITVGIYIAVITVLATAQLGISKEMLKRNLDKRLITVMVIGMMENIIAVGLSTFAVLNYTVRYILMGVIFIGIISFVKFIILLVRIFKANMNQMARCIDEEERYQDRLLASLEIISKYFREHRND